MQEENTKHPKILMTIAEAGTRYGLCRRTVVDLIDKGILPRIKLGHRTVRIPIEEADAALWGLKSGGAQ